MSESSGRPGLEFELPLRQAGIMNIAGIDEAGRGALAGPVTAAAVILPAAEEATLHALREVRDSKQMSPAQRERTFDVIKSVALCWAVAAAGPDEVDSLGLLPATRLAMRRALAGLRVPPDYLLLDHVVLTEDERPQTALVKGDSRSLSIAAASVLAKVQRDRAMIALEDSYPGYGFARHKGYGTAEHRAALQQLGPAPIHRRSYAPVAAVLT